MPARDLVTMIGEFKRVPHAGLLVQFQRFLNELCIELGKTGHALDPVSTPDLYMMCVQATCRSSSDVGPTTMHENMEKVGALITKVDAAFAAEFSSIYTQCNPHVHGPDPKRMFRPN